MKKISLFYFRLFICILSISSFLYGCTFNSSKKVCVKDLCVTAELVESDQERQRGLMFRKNLSEDRGMLFIFEKESLHSFWMKNMRFPLDIIWIDKDKKIVDIYKFALPCKDICKTITPSLKAKFVLEVNAGFVEKNNLKIGERLDF